MSDSQPIQPTHIAQATHQLNRRFYAWVPKILALMVAISGLSLVYPLVHRVWLGEHLNWFDQASWREIIDMIGLIELPRVFVGMCLIMMSIGLAMRARLAWAFSLVVFVPALLVTIYSDWGVTSIKVVYDIVVVGLLVRYWSIFNRSSLTAGSLFAVASLISLIWYSMLGSLYLGEEFSPAIKDMPNAAYFSIVAMSTVGFGDIVPVTHAARLFVISIIVMGITVFATSLGAIVGPIASGKLRQILRHKARTSMRKNHVILCGVTPLAQSLYRSLTAHNELVTVILKAGTESPYPADADVLVGEASSTDLLQEAGVNDANYVLALREDDPDNAFIVLAVKSFTESKAKTVVMVNDSHNLEKIRRVNPDIAFSPQLLGAELLSRALTGGAIDGSLISELFFAKPIAPETEAPSQAS